MDEPGPGEQAQQGRSLGDRVAALLDQPPPLLLVRAAVARALRPDEIEEQLGASSLGFVVEPPLERRQPSIEPLAGNVPVEAADVASIKPPPPVAAHPADEVALRHLTGEQAREAVLVDVEAAFHREQAIALAAADELGDDVGPAAPGAADEEDPSGRGLGIAGVGCRHRSQFRVVGPPGRRR
jgi:hypothetical protein